MLKQIILLLLAIQVLSIRDLYAYDCTNGGIEHCVRCQDFNNVDFPTLNVKKMCLECEDGYYWGPSSQCIVIPDPRQIVGFGRECAVCGAGNVWYATNNTCYSCRYEASKCGDHPCCSPVEDFRCNEGFVLENGICVCRRGDKDFKINGKCHCPEDNTYVEVNDGEIDCPNCTDKCHPGCEKFVCPEGFYLDKDNADPAEACKCKPVHYSCKNGTGPLETECDVCKEGFEKVFENGNGYCYCSCCSIELMYQCVEAVIDDNTVGCAGCPPTQTKIDGICDCEAIELKIGQTCYPATSENCIDHYSVNSELINGEGHFICQCSQDYTLINGSCQ